MFFLKEPKKTSTTMDIDPEQLTFFAPEPVDKPDRTIMQLVYSDGSVSTVNPKDLPS
ncbi:MAG: hypothetical protein AAGL08_11250 [Cyanobacteria bacterium J06573_11]